MPAPTPPIGAPPTLQPTNLPSLMYLDFQARWESRVLDFSTSRLFHSPSRRGFAFCQGRTQSAVSAQAVRSMGEAEASVQVLMHVHAAARQAGSPAHRLDLQAEILNADCRNKANKAFV